jgi:UDP-N-acetylmuramate--alanine ligase
VDDVNVQEILPRISKPITTYGFSEAAQVRAVNVRHENGKMCFSAVCRQANQTLQMDVTLNLAGLHNVLNALAAIAVGLEVGVEPKDICAALAEFEGVGRRMQRYGEISLPDGGVCTLIDDYGHHPVEMKATIAAVRGAFPGRRLLLAFQPHRFSRTRDLFEDFVSVLRGVDALALAEVYAAGEAPVVAADGRALMHALRLAGQSEAVFVANIADMPASILQMARDGDVVLTMGAGSIGGVPSLVKQLAQR